MATRKTRKSSAERGAAGPSGIMGGDDEKFIIRPGPVWRSTISRSIDALSSDPEALRGYLKELRKAGPKGLVDAFVAVGLVDNNTRRRAHIEDWIGDAARVLFRGLIEAGELALETGLPTHTLFVFVADQPRVVITQTRNQITVLLLLAPPVERKRALDGPADNQGGITVVQ